MGIIATLRNTDVDSTRGWIVCLGSFLCNFVVFGSVYSFGVLLIPLTRDFQVGRGVVAWIGSVSSSCLLLFSPVVGHLGLKYGYGKMTAIGGVLVAVFHVASSFAPNVYVMFVSYGLLIGVAYSCSYMPGYAAVGQWFDHYRGLAVGCATAGSGVGTVIYPLIIEQLLQRLVDWRAALRCLGLIDCFLILIGAFMVCRHPPVPTSVTSLRFLLPVVKDRAAQLIAAFNVLANLGWLIPSTHVVADAEDQGYTLLQSSLLLSIFGIASAVGRVLFGWTSDRVGRKYTVVFSIFTMGISTFCWPALTLLGYPGFVVYIAVYGLVSGSVVACILPLIADYFGVQYIGVLGGLALGFSAIGSLLGSPIAGIIYDQTHSYFYSAMLAGSVLTLAAIISLFFPKDGTHNFAGYEVLDLSESADLDDSFS